MGRSREHARTAKGEGPEGGMRRFYTVGNRVRGLTSAPCGFPWCESTVPVPEAYPSDGCPRERALRDGCD